MKHYFVKYTRNFGNTYALRWADKAADIATLTAEGFERITRADALRLARDEAIRRRDDPAFAYYADDHVYPVRECNPADLAPVGKSRVLEYRPRKARQYAEFYDLVPRPRRQAQGVGA